MTESNRCATFFAFVVEIAGFLFLTTNATAGTTSRGQAGTGVVVHQTDLSPEVINLKNKYGLSTDQALQRYWSFKRMEKARPMPLPRVKMDSETQSPKNWGLRSEPGKILASPVVAKGDLFANKGRVGKVTTWPTSVGKLFFKDGSGNLYSCTAAAVNSAGKNLLMTAAHCVYNVHTGRYYVNFIYAPKFFHGFAYPTYVGTYMYVLKKYMNGDKKPSFEYYDIAILATRSGWTPAYKPLVEAFGGNGLYINGTPDEWFNATIFAYPGNFKHGLVMYAWWGDIREHYSRLTAAAGFGHGSSGGPWLYEYNNNTTLGYIRSVTSTGVFDTDTRKWLADHGGHFGPQVEKLYRRAAAQ